MTNAEPLANVRTTATARLGLARAALLEGDDLRCEQLAHEALIDIRDQGWRPVYIEALDVLTQVAVFRSQHERAVRLLAACRTLRAGLGLVLFVHDQQRVDEQSSLLREALGQVGFEVAFRADAGLSLAEAVSYAQRGRGKRPDAAHRWANLTPTEHQVVLLAGQGLSNPAIAQELLMSRNTVKAHLSRAYLKLDVANGPNSPGSWRANCQTNRTKAIQRSIKAHTQLGKGLRGGRS